jgi:hypothetical protein
VFQYFKAIPKSNDLSRRAHQRIACFLAALHTKMLQSLKSLKAEENLDGKGLLAAWHQRMEGKERDYRKAFYQEVVQMAKSFFQEVNDKEAKEKAKRKENVVSHHYFVSSDLISSWQSDPKESDPFRSPRRDPDGTPDDKTFNSIDFAQECYSHHAEKATKVLMQFIGELFPGENPLCVTYFDEAHELQDAFWMLLRVLQAQPSSVKVWYVFMGTKSSISYYSPRPENRESLLDISSCMLTSQQVLSLRLKEELSKLAPPYIALDFDQHVIAQDRTADDIRVVEFETFEHLSKYGRPLYVYFLSFIVILFIFLQMACTASTIAGRRRGGIRCAETYQRRVLRRERSEPCVCGALTTFLP